MKPEDFKGTSISWGTLRVQDLSTRFLDALQVLDPSKAAEMLSEYEEEYRLYHYKPTPHDIAAMKTMTDWVESPLGETVGYNGYYIGLSIDDEDPFWQSEVASILLNDDLFDALQECAINMSEGTKEYYFGNTEGDGSDFGFWECSEWRFVNSPAGEEETKRLEDAAQDRKV